MARDLGDLMWGAGSDRSQSLDGLLPEAGDVTRLHARVRRGRTVRHVREAAVAVPVVAAVAAMGWFGVDRMTRPEPPVTTPEPVVPTPEVTDSPTPTPSDEPVDLVLGDPVTEPGLPTYYAMPDGLLDRTGPGWVVTANRPVRYNGESADEVYEALVSALFLVAPDGTHFLAGRFDAGADVYPVAWTAGSRTVDVIVDTATAGALEERPEQDLMAATYDLATGTFAAREGDAVWPPDTSLNVPRSPSGRGVSLEYGETFTVWSREGAGTEVAYGRPGQVCSPVGWLGDDAFLGLCVDASMLTDGGIDIGATVREYDPVLIQVDLLDGTRVGAVTELRAIAESDPLPSVGDGVLVRDGVLAFPATEGSPYGCWTGAGLWTGDELETLQRPEGAQNIFVVRATGGVAYVEASPGCSGDGGGSTLTAHDLATGTSQLLEPAPADWRPGEPGWVMGGLVAWVVAE